VPPQSGPAAEALDGRHEFGVWGGMTERERRALLRRRPHAANWHDPLTRARDQHTTSQQVRAAARD
jgi:WhiB family transcriptional regulator, redox-sensing transcriptional regulator